MTVGNGLHDRADCQAVEIVVDENQHAQNKGREHRAYTGLDVLCSPASERLRAARLVDQRNDNAQLDQEDEYARRIGYRIDQTLAGDGVHRLKRVEEAAEQTAGKGRMIFRMSYLLCPSAGGE